MTGRKVAFLKVFKYKNGYLGDRGMEGEEQETKRSKLLHTK